MAVQRARPSSGEAGPRIEKERPIRCDLTFQRLARAARCAFLDDELLADSTVEGSRYAMLPKRCRAVDPAGDRFVNVNPLFASWFAIVPCRHVGLAGVCPVLLVRVP